MSEVPVSLAERLVQAAGVAYDETACMTGCCGSIPGAVVAVLRELAKDAHDRALEAAKASEGSMVQVVRWAYEDQIREAAKDRARLAALADSLEENRDA